MRSLSFHMAPFRRRRCYLNVDGNDERPTDERSVIIERCSGKIMPGSSRSAEMPSAPPGPTARSSAALHASCGRQVAKNRFPLFRIMF
jgi:hypothetical protein